MINPEICASYSLSDWPADQYCDRLQGVNRHTHTVDAMAMAVERFCDITAQEGPAGLTQGCTYKHPPGCDRFH